MSQSPSEKTPSPPPSATEEKKRISFKIEEVKVDQDIVTPQSKIYS